MSKYFDINYFGEWLQSISSGLLTGLISGIYVALLFLLPSNPSVGPFLFVMVLFILIIVMSNPFVQIYRQKNNKNEKNTQLDSKNSLIKGQIITITHYWELILLVFIIIVIGIVSYVQPTIFEIPLISVIVGTILALLSSHFMFSTQRRNELKTISKGFCVELECYKEFLQSWIDGIEKLSDSDLMIKLILFDSRFPEISRPFFDSDSLYYALRKEVFQLDSITAKKIFEFYSYIKGAEESRQIILSRSEEHFHPSIQKERIIHIKQNFQKALHLISDIEQGLDSL